MTHGGAPPSPPRARCAPGGRSPAAALQPRASSAWRRRAPRSGISAPAHPVPSPCSRSSPKRLALAARGATAPVRPQGRPRSNPSPARRNESVAAGGAPSVQAPLAARGAVAALTAPPLPLKDYRRLAEKTGWGRRQATRHAGVGGAPGGRDAVPPARRSGSAPARSARTPSCWRLPAVRLCAGGHGRGRALYPYWWRRRLQ